MDASMIARPGLAVLGTSFVLFALVLPLVRIKRQTGRSAYVAERAPTPIHRVAVEGIRLTAAQWVLWFAAYHAFGPEPLDVWRTPEWLAWLGLAVAGAGLLVILIAQAQMGRSWRVGIDPDVPTELVTRGLFAWVRNPIFTGMLLWAAGVVLLTPSPWTVMAWVFMAYLLGLQVRLEEAHLLALHGERYRAYGARVGRFIPAVGKLDKPVLPT